MAKQGFKLRKIKDVTKNVTDILGKQAAASAGGLGISMAIAAAQTKLKSETVKKHAAKIGWGLASLANMAVDNSYAEAASFGALGASAVHVAGEIMPDKKAMYGLAGVGATDTGAAEFSPEESAAYDAAMQSVRNELDADAAQVEVSGAALNEPEERYDMDAVTDAMYETVD
jgi:hypothetical protein